LDRIWERHDLAGAYGARLVRYADDLVLSSQPCLKKCRYNNDIAASMGSLWHYNLHWRGEGLNESLLGVAG
jgi:hypothetical protein